MQPIKKIFYYILLIGVLISCGQRTESVTNDVTQTANDLINETSPYLLQHAYNPVDWKAWNPESLKLAQEQNKLIIISVGYSACHWCHVMEEESFENDSVAKLMNDHFISIKVDREERPDVDQIYMDAVQLMTGSGGWPLNCITLPDGRPVFGGTYFTKEQWTKILKDMSGLYKNDPEKVVAYAEMLTEGIRKSDLIILNNEKSEFTANASKPLIKTWKTSLDFRLGGQKGQPKFPLPSNLDFLLRYSVQNADTELQDYVINTLTKIANGGIYDQIGGGFSRYSIDEKWHVPHFEKMLYDNAQLVSLYTKAYQITKNTHFNAIIEETLTFVERELTTEEGAFYSSLDADSENESGIREEGVYYTWTKDDLMRLLDEDYEMFKSYYNINATGKWEKDQYILFKTKSDNEIAISFNLTPKELKEKVLNWKTKLFNVRNSRIRPRTDDKILTSWNALMLKGYLDAYRVLGDKAYLDIAVKNAHFLKDNQINSNGGLFHNYKNGKSTIEGFSEDYAHTISAFIELYQVTFDEQWLQTAKNLQEYSITHFLDEKSGMFFFTSDTETSLISRNIEVSDDVIPSSNSVLAENLFHLGHYYFDATYSKMAKQMLNNMESDIKKYPMSYSNWLNLYLNYSNPYYEIAISGPNAIGKLNELNKNYLPNILIAGSGSNSDLPILENKFNNEQTYIYVCVEGSCKLPVTEVSASLKQILK